MKTKNMRKKALLASVAMLLVAVVALGGATYAWFTTSASVSASGIKLQTSEQSNLLIHPASDSQPSNDLTQENHNWARSIDLASNAALTLAPTSSVDGTSFYSITSSAPTGVSDPADTDFIVDTISNTGSTADVSFWVMNTDSSTANLKVTGITLSSGADTTIWNGLRCAVYVGSTLKYICNPSGQNNSHVVIASGTYDTTDGKFTVGQLYNATAGTQKGITFAAPTFVSNIGNEVIQANMQANQPYQVTLKFWLEGNVTNNTAINKTLNSISISLEA